MKNHISIIFLLMILTSGCGNDSGRRDPVETDMASGSADGLMLIGKDIITEVIVTPDTLGDPWEVEKVSGYNGTAMYSSIFRNAYSGSIKVYNILTEEPMRPGELKSLEQDISYDYSRIAKLQFIEDWYFDPATNSVTKKVKSVSFGYESKREEGLPPGYTALFRIIPE